MRSCGILLFLCLTYWCTAQVPFPNRCPDVKIPETFDLDAYMGIWYEYSKYPFIFEIGKKCMYAEYKNLGNNTISVVNAAINIFTNGRSNIQGKANVIAPGQLAVMFSPRQNSTKPNYLILGTDYQSYAVVYSCTELTRFAHTKIVWILTRERIPNAAAILAANKIIDDNELSQTFLIPTIQDDCPEFQLIDAKSTVNPNINTNTNTNTNIDSNNINKELQNTEKFGSEIALSDANAIESILVAVGDNANGNSVQVEGNLQQNAPVVKKNNESNGYFVVEDNYDNVQIMDP